MLIKFPINIINKIFLVIIVVATNITGVIKLLSSSSIIAESLGMFFTFLFSIILLIQKKYYNIIDKLFIFTAIYSIIITLIQINLNNIELSSLMGFYYFLLPCFIFLNRNNLFIKKNANFYFRILLITVLINAIYAIYQTLISSAFIPIDGIRARGLMKSTLNYSGILGASFFPLLFYTSKSKFSNFISTIFISIGGVLSLSKGLIINVISGFILSYPFSIFINKKITNKQLKNLFTCFCLSIVFILIAITLIIKTNTIDKFDQITNILNFTTNSSNIERVKSWNSFFEYFLTNPFGFGIGQIHSGTDFVKNSVNFESYALGVIYSIGIIGLIYFSIPLLYLYVNKKLLTIRQIQLYLMFLIGVYIQNTIQVSLLTPATTIITWYNMIFLMNYFKNQNTQLSIQERIFVNEKNK